MMGADLIRSMHRDLSRPLDFTPAPGTWDNRLPEGVGNMVLDHLAGPNAHRALRWIDPTETRASWRDPGGTDPTPDNLTWRTHLFTTYRCAGPAVYVGRPFRWEWEVAVSEDGRWVSGEARQEYLPEDPLTWPADLPAAWDPYQLGPAAG